ncbi:MAG TPA: DUF3159 domain-containing protein [Actinomycetes bacterium]|nr:DUF3159 domain-containing protein [Actinomycetes bacterium]
MTQTPRPQQVSENALLDALGGRRGLIDTALPGIVFVVAFLASGRELNLALIAAIATGAVLLVVRLLRRDTIQYTLSGFVGVIIAAVVARTTGRAEDYFLPGLLLNVGLAFTYLVSILVRWPAIGVIVGPITGEGMSWRQDAPRRAAYTRATWVFFAGQCLRAAIQTPLWLAGALGALAASKLVLGWPLLLLQVWIAYRLLRHVPLSVPATAEPEPETVERQS